MRRDPNQSIGDRVDGIMMDVGLDLFRFFSSSLLRREEEEVIDDDG